MLAYVHYPTVSTDMLYRVWNGNAMCATPMPYNLDLVPYAFYTIPCTLYSVPVGGRF